MRPPRALLRTTISLSLALAAIACANQRWLERSTTASEPSSAKQAAAGETRGGDPAEVTRADLAAAYLRLERAFFAQVPTGERLADVNRSFDKATLAFFTGRNAEAIRAIDALTSSLAAEAAGPSIRNPIIALKAIVDPPVWNLQRLPEATCRVVSLYDNATPEARELEVELLIVDPAGAVVARQPLKAAVGSNQRTDVSTKLDLRGKQLSPGQYRLQLSAGEGGAFHAGYLNVVEGGSLDEQRAENEKQLAQLAPLTPQMKQAAITCQARNRLLSDNSSSLNSAQFLADLNQLARDVASEIQALKSGIDPYQRRQGDYWRTLRVGSRDVPLRIYAPRSATSDEPAPLLVVLHGMGGDENMFPEAYGAGIIKSIADEKGVLIASPLTYGFSDAKSLEACIDMLSCEYAIDKNRIYVLGHSLGASSAAGIAQGRGDLVAGACCIAGGRFQVKEHSPPILVVSPELDAVVPAKALRASAAKAIEGGMRIEIREMPGYGHTLVVGAALPEAVDWLLKHRLTKDSSRSQ